ncbi:Protein kinase domain-containing protein [Aphelenchoides besseyi]|nr:Protein kinase domain-containing protein [Aphelenchoides besseyi]
MSNQVAKFTIENFAQRFKNAQSEDLWSSPLFQMHIPEDDPIKFTLELWPQRNPNPALYFSLMYPRRMPIMAWIGMWVEGAKRKSKVKIGSCEEFEHDTYAIISDFFKRQKFEKFKDEKTISIYVEFSFPITQVHLVPAAEETHFRYQFNQNDFWTSDPLTLPQLEKAKFTVSREPDKEMALNVVEFGEHTKIHVQYELWVENDCGIRSRKFDKFHIFYVCGFTSAKPYDLNEIRTFSEPSLHMCGKVRAWLPVAYEKRYIERISALFNDELFADVEVRVQDKSFKVNRAIISAQSKVFRKMFTYSTNKKVEMETIEFDGSDFDVVEGLFRFIYSNKIDNLDSIALQLLPLADFYEVVDLTISSSLCLVEMFWTGKKRKKSKKSDIPTYETALIITFQTLRGLRNFHFLGRIHRDLKPANYAVGRGVDENTVFIIDFGMAVRFCTDPHRMPTSSAYTFIGTRNYASRNTHKEKPQTRRDDLESWFYVTFEIFKRKFPWAKDETDAIIQMKDYFIKRCPREIYSKVPPCFEDFARMIDETGDYSNPNYDFFFCSLKAEAEDYNLSLDAPLKWNKEVIPPPWPKEKKGLCGVKKQKSKTTQKPTYVIVKNQEKSATVDEGKRRKTTDPFNSPLPVNKSTAIEKPKSKKIKVPVYVSLPTSMTPTSTTPTSTTPNDPSVTQDEIDSKDNDDQPKAYESKRSDQ